MKKSIKTLLVLLIATYAISCGNNTENNHDDHEGHDHEVEKTEPEHEEHAENEFTLDLNNGNLWQANIETTEGIGNMVVLMDSFSDTESVEAYSILSSHLTTTLNMILKECTMEGEPHNHLHTYLYPMFDMIEGIGSTDLDTCKVSYSDLKEQLSAYPNYFK